MLSAFKGRTRKGVAVGLVVVLAGGFGVVNLTTASANAATANCTSTTLRMGTTNSACVIQLKNLLNANLGTHYGNNPIFGPGTKKDVMVYQGKVDLPADGIVGPRTWGALVTRSADQAKAASSYGSTAAAAAAVKARGTEVPGKPLKLSCTPAGVSQSARMAVVKYTVNSVTKKVTVSTVTNTSGGGAYVVLNGVGYPSKSSTVTVGATVSASSKGRVDLSKEVGDRSTCSTDTFSF